MGYDFIANPKESDKIRKSRYDFVPHGKKVDPQNPEVLVDDKPEFKQAFIPAKDPEKEEIVDLFKNPDHKVKGRVVKPKQPIEPVYKDPNKVKV